MRLESPRARLDRCQPARDPFPDRGTEGFEGIPGERQSAGAILDQHLKDLNRLQEILLDGPTALHTVFAFQAAGGESRRVIRRVSQTYV